MRCTFIYSFGGFVLPKTPAMSPMYNIKVSFIFEKCIDFGGIYILTRKYNNTSMCLKYLVLLLDVTV